MTKKKIAANLTRQKGVRKAPKKSAASVAGQIPEATPEQIKQARQRYAEVLVARGQAVPKGQPLTPGATHEVVGHDKDGTPIVSRRRFSLKK